MSERITAEEHTEFANDLARVRNYLNKLFFAWQKKKGKSHPVCKVLLKFIKVGGYPSKVQSEMDTQFHSDVTNEEFLELNHVYYDLESRYKKIRSAEIHKAYQMGLDHRHDDWKEFLQSELYE